MGVPDVIINYHAVLVAALAGIIIGSFWYSPLLFGNIWIKLSKFTLKDMNAAKKKGMGKTYLVAFIGSFVFAYVLAHFAKYIGALSVGDALQLGFWSWLGFIVPVQLGMVLWEGKPLKLYLINIAYHLVTLLVMSMILVAW